MRTFVSWLLSNKLSRQLIVKILRPQMASVHSGILGDKPSLSLITQDSITSLPLYNCGEETRLHIVILGCGRVGARLARHLSSSNNVTVVDQSQASFDRLGSEYSGETLVGNGIDVDCLRSAGTERADLFMALTDGDNRNLMAAQIARQLGVPTVLARVYDAVRADIFDEMGVITFSPTVKGAQRLFNMVVNDSGVR